MRNRTPHLDMFLDDVAKLKASEELLEQVWALCGPYGLRRAFGKSEEADALIRAMQRHFESDDSE